MSFVQQIQVVLNLDVCPTIDTRFLHCLWGPLIPAGERKWQAHLFDFQASLVHGVYSRKDKSTQSNDVVTLQISSEVLQGNGNQSTTGSSNSTLGHILAHSRI